MKFSALNRSEIKKALSSTTFDILVIGGGITGAGIALDAVSRGLKVALVEKSDFAFGTSSRSTKLIHGGLRYLKQFEFGLVKEVGSERAIVHNLAPHLVIPEKMLLPLYEKRGLGYGLTSIGLKIYDWLAGVKPQDQRRMLTRTQTLRAEPMLRPEGVRGGALYAEYRTDDARLTIEIMKAAHARGAVIINYVAVLGFEYNNDLITGVRAEDEITNDVFNVHATCVVNAAGPWVDELRQKDNSLRGKRLQLSKGVHIVVPSKRFPVRQAVYFDVEDGRMIFAIPRGRTTYIGTTDTAYNGSKDDVRVTRDDAVYLLEAVNAMFPSVHLSLGDVESCWAGLRPLIFEEGKSTVTLSRKDEIFESSTGLISIAGGKLTGYRKMAERVVNLIARKHFNTRGLKPCTTERILLGGTTPVVKEQRIRSEQMLLEKFTREGIAAYTAKAVVEGFGLQADEILKSYLTLNPSLNSDLRLVESLLKFCVDLEMVMTLEDFFVRRTGLLYFDIAKVIDFQEHICNVMAGLLSWDESRILREKRNLQNSLDNARLNISLSRD